MIAPENQIHWGRQDYEKIEWHKNFSGADAFCDENGFVHPEFPKGRFENLFSEVDGKTLVTMISTHDSFEDIEELIKMGFKEGMQTNCSQLDNLLKTLQK